MAKKETIEANPKVNQLKMDYQGTFNTEAGKRVLEDLMTVCHIFETEADNVTENIVARAHRRDVIHHIMGRLGYGPQEFFTKVEETSNG